MRFLIFSGTRKWLAGLLRAFADWITPPAPAPAPAKQLTNEALAYLDSEFTAAVRSTPSEMNLNGTILCSTPDGPYGIPVHWEVALRAVGDDGHSSYPYSTGTTGKPATEVWLKPGTPLANEPRKLYRYSEFRTLFPDGPDPMKAVENMIEQAQLRREFIRIGSEIQKEIACAS